MDLFTHLITYCNTMSFAFRDLSFKDVFVLENDIDNTMDVYEILDDKTIAVTSFYGDEELSSIKYDNILNFKTKNIHIYPECWDSVLTASK